MINVRGRELRSGLRDAGSPAWNAVVLGGLLAFAATIRILVNNVAHFSPADETVYLQFVQTLAHGGGYPSVIKSFIEDQSLWVFPNPLRWSYLGTAAVYCAARGACRYRTLATLSTVSGIFAVPLSYWLGVRLFDRRTAIVAVALMATAPLQLAMGRRALVDEFFCFAVLASIVALVEWVRSQRMAWLIAWIAVTTIVFAAKEQFFFIYPVVLAAWWVRERRVHWVWALPPALFFVVFCVLARDVGSFFRIARIITSVMGAPYAAELQTGPPHRLLIDFMTIAPLVTIGFIAACRLGQGTRRDGQVFTLLLSAGVLIVHSLLPSKNLRYVVTADPFMRLLVASWLPGARWTVVALVGNAVVELAIFNYLFLERAVYDPTTNALLRAFRMVE
jgi:hypothetical protein